MKPDLNDIHPLEALSRLWYLAQESHREGRAAATLLLGLYNGERFRFDLTDLRLFDRSNLDDALAVLNLDARPQKEVHQWLNAIFARKDMGDRFEQMSYRVKVKGRCSRENLARLTFTPWNHEPEHQ